MFKVSITDAIISKGYKDAPAFRFNEKKTAVQFKIGQRVYDKNAPDNYRFVNFAVKAFNYLSERVEKMQLKESSRINISGRLDEEQWEENGQKLSRYVIIAEDIEYASNDSNKSNGNGTNNNGAGSTPPIQNGNGQNATQQPPQTPPPAQQQNSSEAQTEMPANFSGFDEFNNGGENVFF